MRLAPADRAYKEVADTLHVHGWTPAGFVHAGTLQLEEAGDRDVRAQFSYAPEWVASEHAYPLDPINMASYRGRYATENAHVTLGAIFDAAPDAWGRRVVRASVSAAEQHAVYRNAFLRGADGIGALVLTPSAHTNIDEIVAMSLAERPKLSQLNAAARAARELESTGEVSDDLRDMLAGSWTIGGARPKAIVSDDRPGAPAGRSLIAKFATLREKVQTNRIEFAVLQMAADMGMKVPGHELVEVDGLPVLLLDRFDRGLGNARRHYLSAMSLVSTMPVSKFLDSPQDIEVFSWSNLMEVTSRVTAKPAAARVEMFSRLALNAALSNTDDHLKNFGMLKLADDPMHYEIAPVFDVTPQASPSHYLHCLDLGRHYTLKDVMARPRELGVSAAAAREVNDRIQSVLARRAEYFEKAGLVGRDAHLVDEWIRRGLGEEPSDVEAPAAEDEPERNERMRGG